MCKVSGFAGKPEAARKTLADVAGKHIRSRLSGTSLSLMLKIQESQFTTLGQNITALEVDGVFDDCQALVKSAFMDEELNKHMKLTSANSITVPKRSKPSFLFSPVSNRYIINPNSPKAKPKTSPWASHTFYIHHLIQIVNNEHEPTSYA